MHKKHSQFSWMNPKLEVRETAACGKGVFAKSAIVQGERICVLGGAVISGIEESGDAGIQIAEDLIFVSPDPEDAGNFFNHSCDPNAGFQGQIVLVAMRSILAGEEITFDYAMCLHPAPGSPRYEMPCRCGKTNCRKVITEDDWTIPELQYRYDGYFQWYLQNKINAGKSFCGAVR
jgi:SET domain-containing protein